MFLSIGDSVKNAIEYGVDLLRDGAGIDVTAITFITQIAATLVLFLIVRFFFWNKVTDMIDKRKALIEQDINSKDEALKELETAKIEAQDIITGAKEEALSIRERAVTASKKESSEIMARTLEEIENKKALADEQIQNDREKMEEGIREEIISVAYVLAEKITEKEIDQNKHNTLVDNFLKEEGYDD